MSRGDTRSRRADVQGLGELDELHTGRVRTPNKNGDLQLDSRRATRYGIVQALPCLHKPRLHSFSLGTLELVRTEHLTCHYEKPANIGKYRNFKVLERDKGRKVIGKGLSFSENAVPFLKCANGTLLPLTVRRRFATMSNRERGKIFATLLEVVGFPEGTKCLP